MPTCDFLIIGGGVVGLSVARELKSREPQAKVVLIEKEATLGAHASGRNSGVIHSGIYYTAVSLKAKLTRDGGRALMAFCEEKGIPVRRCGKLIVARNAEEHPMLDELLRRGAANGVEVQGVSEEEARRIEPRAKTAGRALFVPATASVDPRLVIAALEAECRAAGVKFLAATKYLGVRAAPPPRLSLDGRGSRAGRGGEGEPTPLTWNAAHSDLSLEGRGDLAVRTSGETWSAGFVVNCAGLYADKIALDFGFSKRYRILPFKGLYLESDEPAGSLRCHVYPVPAKTNPFLGVHATVKADGHWKIGPTAIPALWRENYGGLTNFDAGEFLEIAARQISLLFGSDFDFRTLAWEEIRKQSRRRMIGLAAELVAGISDAGLPHPAHSRRPLPPGEAAPKWWWGVPGIRAQLVDIESKKLVGDFVLEGDGRSLHVLNAVSPAFTCALSFSKWVVDGALSASRPWASGGEAILES
jgi:L-2-hydroxyglutarate oxidase